MAPVTECVCARVFIWWQECECQCMSNMFIVVQVVSHVTCHCFERKRKKSYANFSRWFNKVIYILISPKTESSFLFWFVVSTSKKWRLWLTCADCQLPSHRHQNSRRFWEWHHPPKGIWDILAVYSNPCSDFHPTVIVMTAALWCVT